MNNHSFIVESVLSACDDRCQDLAHGLVKTAFGATLRLRYSASPIDLRDPRLG